jgi:hypothetical protein
MGELSLMLDAIDRTVAWLKMRESRQDRRSIEINAVWSVLRDAATRTRAYLADRRSDRRKRDRAEERAIAASWNAVGLAIRGLGGEGAQELADQCFAKADYWADPERWELSPRRDLDISLENVEQAIRERLKKK